MLENFKSYFSRGLDKKELVNYIFALEEHQWMHEDQYLKANLTDFFERLPAKVLQKVFKQDHTILVRANGRYACSVQTHHQAVILVFPEIYNQLKRLHDGHCKAILAHEIGHIYLDHHKENDDVMESQVDADAFACDMGYLEELETFLHDLPESVEKRVRLSFITTYYFGNN